MFSSVNTPEAKLMFSDNIHFKNTLREKVAPGPCLRDGYVNTIDESWSGLT